MGLAASRICGSSDLYQRSGKGPECSVNFITSHDGFTLNDLVSYRQKHNEANGEDNHDGRDGNDSENCGFEGPSNDPTIEALRKRLIKNFLLTLFVSRGIPMLLGGDEFRRTQHGNNNAYCQDNEISWYNWQFLQTNQEIHRFTRDMIAFRRAHPVLRKEAFYSDEDLIWFGPQGSTPDWLDPQQKSLACLIFGREDPDIFLIFNASTRPEKFSIPDVSLAKRWYMAVETFLPNPNNHIGLGEEISRKILQVGPRSSAILVGIRG